MALALSAAAQAVEAERCQERLELVWTGPDSRLIPLRRTDQALLQLIDGAAGDPPRRQLRRLPHRGHRPGPAWSRVVASPSLSTWKRRTPAKAASLRHPGRVRRRRAPGARIYIWPLEKRPLSADGRHGSLHAKVAIADGRVMLISSANLTEYAMTLNMELGVLINGGPSPEKVAEHLGRLVEMGTFRRFEI